MHACMHEDMHDVVRAVTGEILAGEGEEGVLSVQAPTEVQLREQQNPTPLKCA